MIDIQETEKEYLLFIPISQKERAKSIEGRRWDPDRKAWVYPKTGRSYDALISEFGDDLINVSITRPELPTFRPRESSLAEENKALREQLTKIQQALDLLAGSTGDQNKTQALQTALASAEKELISIKELVRHREQQLETTNRDLKALQDELEDLKKNITISKDKLHLDKAIKERAKQATGNDPDFVRILDKLNIDLSLPLEIVKELENSLRRLLATDDRNLNLYDLLAQAKDAQLLADEAYDLAHSIRKQRNILAHEQVDKRTHIGRVLFVLFAASLLWPHLPE